MKALKNQSPNVNFMIFSSIFYLTFNYEVKSFKILMHKSFNSIFWLIFNSSKAFSIIKSRVPNAPSLKLKFCPFLDHKWKYLKATIFKFSKELLNTFINDCKKFYGHGLSHCYTPSIWNSIPVLLATPVAWILTRQTSVE